MEYCKRADTNILHAGRHSAIEGMFAFARCDIATSGGTNP